jgi:polyhydroxyalkanoate synthesis regulator protein
MSKTLSPFMPPGIEDMSRKNLAMMERAMHLFTPFYREGETTPVSQASQEYQEEIISLRAEVERLQQQLASLRAAPKKAG